MEDDLWWKTTFDRRQPLMEEDFDGRHPLMEDNVLWKTIFHGRQPLMAEEFQWKHLMENYLQ